MWTRPFTAQGVTLSDRVVIQVTATVPPPIATFTLQPSGTNFFTGLNNTNVCQFDGFFDMSDPCSDLTATATDIHGNPVPLAVHFRAQDTSVVSIRQDGSVFARLIDRQTELYAESWAYGVIKRDSLRFSVLANKDGGITINEYTPYKSLHPYIDFEPRLQTITAGGIIAIGMNAADIPVDIVFDDPTAALAGCEDDPAYHYSCDTVPVRSGNFPVFTRQIYQHDGSIGNGDFYQRRFIKPGTYGFHSSLYPLAKGVIIVKDSVPTQ